MFPTINCQWTKATDVDLENYRQCTHGKLSSITVPSIVYCNDALFNNDQHQHLINGYYITHWLLCKNIITYIT